MTGSTDPISIKLPHGEHASFEEMQAYGSVMQSFICTQEALLEDIEDVRHHNDKIDYLQSLASSYNEQLRLYKAAEARRQRDALSALLVVVNA
jgi:hypothetical protein